MESRAKLFGHPMHQMLVVFPLGLLATSVFFDIAALVSDNGRTFATVAYWLIAAGLVGGLVAAVPGFIDWRAIPAGTRAKRIGMAHGLGNVAVLVCFLAAWLLRTDAADLPHAVSFSLSVTGVGIALLTGWLGGELVSRLGVGVTPGAHLDAPSSLKTSTLGPDAGETARG